MGVIQELFKLNVLLCQQQNLNLKSIKGDGMPKALVVSLEKEMQTTAEASEDLFSDVRSTLNQISQRCGALQLHADDVREAARTLGGRLSKLERQVSLSYGINPV